MTNENLDRTGNFLRAVKSEDMNEQNVGRKEASDLEKMTNENEKHSDDARADKGPNGVKEAECHKDHLMGHRPEWEMEAVKAENGDLVNALKHLRAGAPKGPEGTQGALVASAKRKLAYNRTVREVGERTRAATAPTSNAKPLKKSEALEFNSNGQWELITKSAPAQITLIDQPQESLKFNAEGQWTLEKSDKGSSPYTKVRRLVQAKVGHGYDTETKHLSGNTTSESSKISGTSMRRKSGHQHEGLTGSNTWVPIHETEYHGWKPTK